MVQPFEKALEKIAQNTQVMAEQMPIITDSVQKIYKVESTENKKEEKEKVEKERVKGDPSGGQGSNAEVVKGLSAVTGQLQSLKRLIKNNHKEEQQSGESNPLGFLSKFFGKGKQEGGFVYKSPIQKFAKGGGVYTVPGTSTGDNHPMLLPTGSFVLNREASKYLDSIGGNVPPTVPMGFEEGGMVPTLVESKEKIFGPGSWDGLIPILNSVIPRFQSGGLVSHDHTGEGYNPSNGRDAQGRPVVFSKEAAAAFAKMMAEGGVNPKDVTSSKRSPAHNKRVGGVPNSNHLTGNAVDIHGSSKLWMKQNGEQYGWKWLDYSGHDGHFDFIKGMGGGDKPPKEGKEEGVKGNKEGDNKEGSLIKKGLGALSMFGIPMPQMGEDSSNGEQQGSGGLFGGFKDMLLKGIAGSFFGMMFPNFAKEFMQGFSETYKGFGSSLLGNNESNESSLLETIQSGASSLLGIGDNSGSEAPVALSGDIQDKAKMMYEYIKGKGYTSAQAKGIVANIHRESTFDPKVRSGDDQWTGRVIPMEG